jgi:RIO kinase 1
VEERRSEDRDETDDAVFMSSFIPRNLGEVYDPERDVELVNAGRGDELIYSTLAKVATGAKKGVAASGPTEAVHEQRGMEEAGKQEDNGIADQSSDTAPMTDSEDKEDDKARPKGFRNEDKDAKKVCLSFEACSPASIRQI